MEYIIPNNYRIEVTDDKGVIIDIIINAVNSEDALDKVRSFIKDNCSITDMNKI
jgi:hypothetical protein